MFATAQKRKSIRTGVVTFLTLKNLLKLEPRLVAFPTTLSFAEVSTPLCSRGASLTPKQVITGGTCRAPARSRLAPHQRPQQEATPRSPGGHRGPRTNGDPRAHPPLRATPRTRKPSPASHPRRPAAQAAPEPPGRLLASRREGAPAAREAAGCSEKTLPSSAGLE